MVSVKMSHVLHSHPTVTKSSYCRQLCEHIDYKYADPDALNKFTNSPLSSVKKWP